MNDDDDFDPSDPSDPYGYRAEDDVYLVSGPLPDDADGAE